MGKGRNEWKGRKGGEVRRGNRLTSVDYPPTSLTRSEAEGLYPKVSLQFRFSDENKIRDLDEEK